MNLTNALCVVTGATEGIGRSIAFALGREGARVAICARTAPNVETTLAEVRAANPRTMVCCEVYFFEARQNAYPADHAWWFRDATVALLGSALKSGVGDPPRERRGAIRATSVGRIAFERMSRARSEASAKSRSASVE